MTVSQNGWPASDNRDEIGVQTFTIPDTDIRVPLRADIAPLLLAMAMWWRDTVEDLMNPGCWGYNYRVISGSTTISNHGSGTALDVNAPLHPLGARGTVPDHLREAISSKARSLGLRWGGDYDGRVDEMHVEINVDYDTAMRLVAELQGGGIPDPDPQPTPDPSEPRTLSEGDEGEDVRELQRILNAWYPLLPALDEDGIYGPLTADRVRYLQGHAEIEVDGICGPDTRRVLGFTS